MEFDSHKKKTDTQEIPENSYPETPHTSRVFSPVSFYGEEDLFDDAEVPDTLIDRLSALTRSGFSKKLRFC